MAGNGDASMAVDPARYAMIQNVIAAQKVWTTTNDMRDLWTQATQRKFPKPFFFRVAPEINGMTVEGIFIEARYKQTHVPGNRDSLNFSLVIDGTRALGLDDNGPSKHFNTVGVGLPFHRKTADHPHFNFSVPEALIGYAEPIAQASPEDLWTAFVNRANIIQAPTFMLPVGQTEFPI